MKTYLFSIGLFACVTAAVAVAPRLAYAGQVSYFM